MTYDEDKARVVLATVAVAGGTILSPALGDNALIAWVLGVFAGVCLLWSFAKPHVR
jgi:hypothetical protein